MAVNGFDVFITGGSLNQTINYDEVSTRRMVSNETTFDNIQDVTSFVYVSGLC